MVPGGLSADVSSGRLGQRATSTKLERLKHTTLRHAGNLHSIQTANVMVRTKGRIVDRGSTSVIYPRHYYSPP